MNVSGPSHSCSSSDEMTPAFSEESCAKTKNNWVAFHHDLLDKLSPENSKKYTFILKGIFQESRDVYCFQDKGPLASIIEKIEESWNELEDIFLKWGQLQTGGRLEIDKFKIRIINAKEILQEQRFFALANRLPTNRQPGYLFTLGKMILLRAPLATKSCLKLPLTDHETHHKASKKSISFDENRNSRWEYYSPKTKSSSSRKKTSKKTRSFSGSQIKSSREISQSRRIKCLALTTLSLWLTASAALMAYTYKNPL